MEALAPSSSASSCGGSHLSEITPFARPYDVFVNHRGPDVKKTLANSIYYWLTGRGLRVFVDKEEFQPGDGLHHTIKDAINSASVHVAIFSRNYAESSWCLDELCLMLKSSAPIIPVYYDVQPSDLRRILKRKSVYYDAFVKHEKKGRFPRQRLEDWKEALREISDRYGLELNGSEFNGEWGKLLKTIEDTVLKLEAEKMPLHAAKYPVGLDDTLQDFQRFLESNDGKIVGIVGFGGSGKTTLAKEFYNRKRLSFAACSLLSDVRRHGADLLTLQRQLLKDLRFINDSSKIDNLDQGRGVLRKRLGASSSAAANVLIILDDIDHVNQFEDLLGTDVFGWSALIILTSRDGSPVLEISETAPVYRMRPLDSKQAQELFCWHAFCMKHPGNGFGDLVEKFCEKCGRLPLFLTVMGAHLRGTNKDDWEYELEHTPEGMEQIIKISYDALRKEEKQIFLDIACFFLGEDKSLAIRVWEGSEGRGSRYLKKLENKCLVEFDDRNCLQMHDHLRDFGREIAKGEPTYRLWHPDLIANNQEQFRGGKEVRGIVAAKHDTRYCHSYQTPLGEILADIKLSSLKLLVIEGDCFEERFLKQCTDLVWLRWYNCPRTNISPSLSMNALTVLELLGGNLREWQLGDGQALNLKEVKIRRTGLSYISIPPNVCPNLERLDLGHNRHLIEVEDLPTTLIQLNLEKCTALQRLSGSFNLPDLRELNISECFQLNDLPNLEDLNSLEKLQASMCGKLHKIQGLEHLRKLQELDISECFELQELPNLGDLRSLETLQAHWCSNLNKIQSLDHLRKLQMLDIGECCELRELPNLADMSSLKTLKVHGCRKLLKIQGLQHLRSLQELDISKCPALYELPNLADLSSLKTLKAHGCTDLNQIQGLEHLRKLQELDINNCYKLYKLPNLAGLSSLKTLKAYGCTSLKEIQGLEHLRKLRELDISGCSEFYELPNLAGLSSLETLEAHKCTRLNGIQGLEHLRKLKNLDISGCPELNELPNLADLSSLETLKVHGCYKLYKIKGLEQLRKLRELDIRDCFELQELPNLADLRSLVTFKASGQKHKVAFEYLR